MGIVPRGRDSFGYLVLPEGKVFKSGNTSFADFLMDDDKKTFFDHLEGCNGIFMHTRAATTGSPKIRENNHPFFIGEAKDGNFRFVLSHNGVISNDIQIRERFGLDDMKGNPETDTWVIIRLIQYFLDATNFRHPINVLAFLIYVIAFAMALHIIYATILRSGRRVNRSGH